MRRPLLWLVLFALIIAAWGSRPWFLAGTPGSPINVIVPRGATLGAAASALQRAGLVRAGRFRLLARVYGNAQPVRAGTYRLTPGQPWQRYLDLLQGGRTLRLRITIPEGLPSVMVRDRLLAAPELTGDVAVPPEGSLLPETYDYRPGEPRTAVLKRMQTAMVAALDKLWPARARNTPVKTRAEAVTFASIIEKETGKPAERAMVSGVYANRLRQGIKLDADPTVIYSVTHGRPLGRRILKSELAADTGYNTYLKPGLPNGPITNPGRASLAAALHPAGTKALYFVADGQGGHVFADTLGQHQANVRKWFAIRRVRGEM